MNCTHRILASVLVVFLLLGLVTSFALAAPPAQDAANGKVLWEESLCKNCHGDAGEGKWAWPLAGNQKNAEEWIAQVRSPRGIMGQFTPEKISDATIIDMQAYLTSLAAPASFAMATADLPDDALPGQKLVESKKCIACHTATGPMRGFLAREETPTAAAVIAQLRTPKQHMPMYSAEVISDEEAGLVAAFLVSQMPPTTMPTTGGAGLSSLVLTLLLCGAALTLIGLAFRASRTRS